MRAQRYFSLVLPAFDLPMRSAMPSGGTAVITFWTVVARWPLVRGV